MGWEGRGLSEAEREVGPVGEAVNAKLKSLDFRLMWAVESPREGPPVLGGICMLNSLWHRVEGGWWVGVG